MKNRKLIWIAATISLIGSILVFMGNGCSGQFTPKNFKNASETGLNSANDADMDDIIPGAKTASLAYANQIIDHLASCAGVQTPSDATMLVYENKKGAISVYGAANTVTSPMMMSVASVAGEICNDLIQQEISRPRIFKNFDLTSNALPNQNDVKDAITRLALSCWQRQDTDAERNMLIDAVNSLSTEPSLATKKSALLVCTSMLSSLDALTN